MPAGNAVRLPDGVSFADGACLGIPAMTAHRCLFVDGPIAGKTVLVTGAAGGVGQYAVQLAKWAGATVIATVSSAEKAAQARAIGADHVCGKIEKSTTPRVRSSGAADHSTKYDAGIRRTAPVADLAELAAGFWPEDETADDINS